MAGKTPLRGRQERKQSTKNTSFESIDTGSAWTVESDAIVQLAFRGAKGVSLFFQRIFVRKSSRLTYRCFIMKLERNWTRTGVFMRSHRVGFFSVLVLGALGLMACSSSDKKGDNQYRSASEDRPLVDSKYSLTADRKA